MTVSPVRFGWAYMVHGTTAERQQAAQDAFAEAAQQTVDFDVLADVEKDTDLYVTEGDVATYQQYQSEIARYFAIRQETLDEAADELKKSTQGSGSISQADKGNYVYHQQVLTNSRLNPALDALNSLWGITVDPYIALQGAVPAQDVTTGIANGWFDIATSS